MVTRRNLEIMKSKRVGHTGVNYRWHINVAMIFTASALLAQLAFFQETSKFDALFQESYFWLVLQIGAFISVVPISFKFNSVKKYLYWPNALTELERGHLSENKDDLVAIFKTVDKEEYSRKIFIYVARYALLVAVLAVVNNLWACKNNLNFLVDAMALYLLGVSMGALLSALFIHYCNGK